MKRGLVIGGMYECHSLAGGKGFKVVGASIDPQFVKSSILYWDRIDVPDNDFVSVRLPNEFSVLQQEGILSRQNIKLGFGFAFATIASGATVECSNTSINGKILMDADKGLNLSPLRAFERLTKSDKGTLWSFAKNSNTVLSPNEDGDVGKSLQFEMYNALPVPSEISPFADILEFKNKRGSELIALRSELDDLYLRVSQEKDAAFAKAIALNKVENALNDLDNAMKETWLTKLINLDFEVRWKELISTTVATGGMAFSSSGNLLHSAALGGVAGASAGIQIKSSNKVFSKNLPDRHVPYRYVLNAKRELLAERKVG
jgi:hypothetical protein